MTFNVANKKLEILKIALDCISDPAAAVDSSGQVLVANNLAENYTDLAEKVQYINQRKPEHGKALEPLRQDLKVDCYEVSLTTKEGTKAAFIVTAKAIECENVPLKILVFRQAPWSNRAEVKPSLDLEQKYRALFTHAPLGIMVIDPETMRFEEFNDLSHTQLGYTREEFGKITLYDIQSEETPQQVRERIKKVLDSEVDKFVTKHKTKTGEIRNVFITTKRFCSSGKTYIQYITHDITENQKVQDALAESEARFQQLVNVTNEGIWAINNDFETVFINPRMAEMLGYKEEEMLGKKIFNYIEPSAVVMAQEILQSLDASEKRQYEYEFPTKNGGHIPTTLTVSAIADTKNQKMGFLAVISDTTKRKQLEQDLRASEERFRAISTFAMDAIILSDKNDRILYWNPAAEKIHGFSEEEATGKKLSELIVPKEKKEKYVQLLSRLGKEQISIRETGLTGLRKDGSTFPIDLSIVSVKLQEKDCLLTIVKDITEWKIMEEKLRRKSDLLEHVTSSTNIMLAIIDRNYRIVWVNKKATDVTGLPNLEGRLCYRTFCNGSPGICEGCGVKRVFDNGEEIVRRDYYNSSSNFWVELISTPIRNKKGEVIAALEIAIDINERKILQSQLAEYSQNLEEIVQKRTEELKKTQTELLKAERLAAIGELAGMIGHDLRNPLTGIKNATYYLKKKGFDLPPHQAKEMIDTIDRCVDYSNRIINDLLDYAREIHLFLEPRSPKRLLEEALTLIDIPNNITVKNLLKESPTLEVDPDKIKRVFINLTKNAIEAMPEGGEITVDCRELNGSLEIAFHDTGKGISEETLPKLFTPLYTTKAQGMGFGLAICKRIIEAHKGTISIKSVINQGSTFTLTLPLNQKMEKRGENIG